MPQGFSFYGAVQNNLSAFKLTTFSEWLMLFLFALFLIREMIVLYKSGKKMPDRRTAVLCQKEHIPPSFGVHVFFLFFRRDRFQMTIFPLSVSVACFTMTPLIMRLPMILVLAEELVWMAEAEAAERLLMVLPDTRELEVPFR